MKLYVMKVRKEFDVTERELGYFFIPARNEENQSPTRIQLRNVFLHSKSQKEGPWTRRAYKLEIGESINWENDKCLLRLA